jgi:ABC-type multidrug transport system ATPase subunit
LRVEVVPASPSSALLRIVAGSTQAPVGQPQLHLRGPASTGTFSPLPGPPPGDGEWRAAFAVPTALLGDPGAIRGRLTFADGSSFVLPQPEHRTLAGASVGAEGIEIEAVSLTKTVASGQSVISGVSLKVMPGEIVAIVGGSGAGKTTLLSALAGLVPVTGGQVRVNGMDRSGKHDAFRGRIGFVPQDDIIHPELTLERTLRYAARLRLAASATPVEIDAAAKSAMESLGLAHRAKVRVGNLSGGQRKRASIAVELLTRPHAFFLDEPTSGLDPSSGADLLRTLRTMARGGSTVLLTTHAVQDLDYCDRIVFLAAGGHLAFIGTLEEARLYFGVDRVEGIYERLATEAAPARWAQRFEKHRTAAAGTGLTQPPSRPSPNAGGSSRAGPRAGFLRQWLVLTQRTLETLARNPLTLAILIGCPAMIVMMFVILFKPGAFDFAHPSPGSIPVILFWVCFGVFFFGLTYGLLQVVTERAIVTREHFVGQNLGAYLLAKFTVLMPFLLLVVLLLVLVLRLLNRLPAESLGTYGAVALTLALTAGGALTLGLLTSAAVANAPQATLALPMLCFPAVLFSGAILPVHQMVGVGGVISTAIIDRWAFEGLGRALHIRHLLAHGGSPLGPPLLRTFGNAGTMTMGTYYLLLSAFVVAFFLAAWLVLSRRVRALKTPPAAST